ncbi:hypothetical protein N9O28_03085 [Emcibacteraceae bacterium]|nr:hypothetical protein [Emcibacteraceae bacterium]
MIDFHYKDPSLESLFRAIILFGDNSATYKFALGTALIELGQKNEELIKMRDLAEVFSRHLCNHVKQSPKQWARSDAVQYGTICERFLRKEISKDELINYTEKNAFKDVINRFHTVDRKQLEKEFYIDERKVNGGIRLTDNLFDLVENKNGAELLPEVDARWRLVETAWEMRVANAALMVNYDKELKSLFIQPSKERRKTITSCRNALNGYQRSQCFYCYGSISLKPNASNVCHVDHFLPYSRRVLSLGDRVNQVWNLVLSCSGCNLGKGAQSPDKSLLKDLHRRNEWLIGSHHPLRNTIIDQTGITELLRRKHLEDEFYHVALSPDGWKPKRKESSPFE